MRVYIGGVEKFNFVRPLWGRGGGGWVFAVPQVPFGHPRLSIVCPFQGRVWEDSLSAGSFAALSYPRLSIVSPFQGLVSRWLAGARPPTVTTACVPVGGYNSE